MLSFKVFIVLAACLPWSYCKVNHYCALCKDHTMCKYSGPGKDCVDIGESGVTEEDKKEIVDVHNWLRGLVASGHESRGLDGSQPKAANLRKLVWDDELAKVAQRWADQCRFQHDTCRKDPRWSVGQNIYWKWKYPKHVANWTEAIYSWYNEVSHYNPSEVPSYRFEPSTGHYTQMLWHDTHSIGCGRRDYGANKLYVCNYGPAGNWLGEPLYTIGEPCSKCPEGTVCEENLCASPKINSRVDIPDENKGLFVNTVHEGTDTEKIKLRNDQSEYPDSIISVEDGRVPGWTRDQNTDEENEIVLDKETKSEIEKIHSEMEKLLKSFIKKCRALKRE